jgi:hypothetical protein
MTGPPVATTLTPPEVAAGKGTGTGTLRGYRPAPNDISLPPKIGGLAASVFGSPSWRISPARLPMANTHAHFRITMY